MAYDAGTITSAANAETDLATKVEALFNLDTTGGRSPTRNWSFVEEIPAGAGAGQSGSANYSVRVYKCAGSGTDANDSGVDFYVTFKKNVTQGTSPEFSACEMYDATAGQKKFKRQLGKYVATSIIPDAGTYTWNDTYGTAAVAQFSSGSTKLNGSASTQVSTNNTGYSYWIKLTKNTLVVSVRAGSAQYGFIIGIYDSLKSPTLAALDVPGLYAISLISGSVSGSNATDGCVSRLPGLAVSSGASANNNIWCVVAHRWTAASFTTTNIKDLFLDSEYQVDRMMLYHRVLTGGNKDIWGGIVGLVKPDVMSIVRPATDFQIGDTLTIDSNTWVIMGYVSTQSVACLALVQAN